MSNSKHFAMRQAVVAALATAPALAGGRIVANHRRPMAEAVPEQIFVYLEDSVATRGEIKGAPTDWRTRIRVESVARDTRDVTAEAAADALATAVYGRVMADPSLGGIALDVEAQAIAWTEDEADTTLTACQQIFSIWHRTADNTIAN